jgi:DNA-binding LacI/PurR family transcriptional regulator
MATPTIRSLARALGLSRSTVSEALRGSPRVSAETAQRVRELAAAQGYRPNPLASAVMSELRRSHADQFRGVLAVVSVEEPQRPADAVLFFRDLTSGARDRAAHLGFTLEDFQVERGGVSVQRLDSILQSRGIAGIMLLPAWEDPEFSRLDWTRYAGAYADFFIDHPALHSVCCDHHRSMMLALTRLHALGYRRPGLLLHRHQDERLQHRWEGAYLAFQRHTADIEPIPPLVMDEINREGFTAWFRRERPDVVLGHHTEATAWMESCGARIPETHGFFCLNLGLRQGAFAGLDQRPRLLGAHTIEIVTAQIQRNEFGVPEHPSLTTIPGVWVDGPTVRARAPGVRARSRQRRTQAG